MSERINNLHNCMLYAMDSNTSWNKHTLQYDAEELARRPTVEVLASGLLILAQPYKDVVWC